MKLERVFTPWKIGRLEIKNRFVVPAMSCSFCEPMSGEVTQRYIDYYTAKAAGGFGLLITEYTTVNPNGKAVPGQPGLWNDDQIEGHKRLTESVHENGAKIFCQLHHAGRETVSALTGSPTISSSAVMSPLMPEMPHELTIDEIHSIVENFKDAAVRAKKAGYDGVEVHGGHGYFLAQFLSAYVNKRTDKYGGSFVNRARIVTEIIEGIKEKCGEDFPVSFRISTEEFTPGGNSIEEAKVFCLLAQDAGADVINASTGNYFNTDVTIGHASMGHAWLTNNSKAIREMLDIPVIAVNRINDPVLAESIIRGGKADAVAMGRASLADPAMPNKAKEGRFEEIRTCMGCLQGCYGHFFKGLPTTCILNPTVGREAELAIKRIEGTRKVFVAGGGPAGMEAAIVAAERGCDVELFEKKERLGGHFKLAGVPPYKEEANGFTAWQINQLVLKGVKVNLGTELTAEYVKEAKPDSVIVATGGNAFVPPITGKDEPIVTGVDDVLEGKVQAGASVVIIGGGQVGAETADFLAIHNKKVTIVEMLPEIAAQEEGPARRRLLRNFTEYGVDTYVNTKVDRISEEGVEIITEAGEKVRLNADTVVIATGYRADSSLADNLEETDCQIITIGDAVKVRNAEDAVREGYEAGLKA